MCVCDRDLLDIVTQEDEVDTAEAELGDDEKQVDRPSETERERGEKQVKRVVVVKHSQLELHSSCSFNHSVKPSS